MFHVYYLHWGERRPAWSEYDPPAVLDLAADYTRVGCVEAIGLEQVFRVMNVVDGSDFEMPQKLRCRSMCVGDVAIDADGQAHYCASVGWRLIEVRPEDRALLGLRGTS